MSRVLRVARRAADNLRWQAIDLDTLWSFAFLVLVGGARPQRCSTSAGAAIVLASVFGVIRADRRATP